MNKKKIATKIALFLVLCMALVTVFASCGSNTSIKNDKDLSYWAGTSAETDSENETGSEVETGSEAESGSETEVETGKIEGDGTKKDVILDADRGFIDTFLNWIGTFLSWITKVMPANTYILTLLVFALIVEIVMLPFSIKQQKNSIRQAKLRPKEMAIRRKYAGRNDQATQQKVTQEIQELYQKENFNPMGGCLPLLIQLPIIIVLYWVVVDPLQYVYGLANVDGGFAQFMASFMGLKSGNINGSVELVGKIRDLYQTSDPAALKEQIMASCGNGEAVWAEIVRISETEVLNFNIGPLNLGLTPSFTPENKLQLWLLVIPVLTFVVYFFSSKLTRKLTGAQPAGAANDKQAGCSNNMMDVTMPLMSVWMTFIVPAVIGVYWIMKSIIGFGKQLIMSRIMPLPTFTEEDYKAAEREMFGKQPKRVQKSENAGKVRSLHHIDDEDYDEKGNYVPKEEPAEETEAEKPGKLPENRMTEGASLKDDSDRANGDEGEKKKFPFFGKKDKKD